MADYYKTRRHASQFIETSITKSQNGVNLLSLALSVQKNYGLGMKFVNDTVGLLKADGRISVEGKGENPIIIPRL